jgi:predicted GNAT family acetyltransferase
MSDETPDMTLRQNEEASRFEAQVGDQLAIAEYQLAGTNIIFTHTEVPQELEGQGIGSALAKFALDTAVERGYKIQPLCPFINSYIRRHPEYKPHAWNM